MKNTYNNTELATRYKEGDAEALNELITQNIGLVKSTAKHFINRGTDFEDLIQIGSIGLIKAAKAFNPELGYEFSTYAFSMITGEIRRHFRDDGLIKVSRNIKTHCSKILHEKEMYEMIYGNEPTVSYLAEKCGISIEDAVICLGAMTPAQSLNEINNENVSLENKLGTDYIDEYIEKMALKSAVSELSKEEQLIIHLRYNCMLTQFQTAERLKTNQVRISRKEKSILEKLRKKLN